MYLYLSMTKSLQIKVVFITWVTENHSTESKKLVVRFNMTDKKFLILLPFNMVFLL